MGVVEQFQRVRARLHHRAHCYRAVFTNVSGDLGPAAEVVMRDLARYCYASKTTLKVSPTTQRADPIAMAFAEGRRDVYNRIISMLNLNPDLIDRIANYRSDDE